jgi:cytoskeletal protein RodZ
MLTLLKSKIALAIIGMIGVGTVTATAAVASAHHAGPFAVNTTQQQGHDADPTKTAKANNQEYHAQGQIVSVTFAAGSTNSGSLVLRPNGQQQTVTVTFTSATHVEVTDKDAHHAWAVGHCRACRRPLCLRRGHETKRWHRPCQRDSGE